jgi:hypothetical protein
MKSILLIITFLFSLNIHAQTELTFAYEAAVYVNAMSMSVPPLQLLEMKKGNTRIQGQYIQYDGKYTDIGEGVYEGQGSAANFSYAFGKKWGFYSSYMGTTIQSDLKLVNQECTSCITNDVNDVDASLHTISVGLVYSLINKKRIKLPIFLGPTYTFGTITQTVIRYENTGDEDVKDHFDLKGDTSFGGVLFGAQLGLYFSNWMIFKPYFLYNDSFKRCNSQVITSSRQITDGLSGGASSSCGTDTDHDYFLENDFMTVGASVEFPSLFGLSFTMSKLISTPPIENESIIDEDNITIYSIGLSFGSR